MPESSPMPESSADAMTSLAAKAPGSLNPAVTRAPRTLDPIGIQVLQYALGTITDEMHTTLVRTARSTNIKDREDTSSALFTPDGRVLAQSEYATPVHLGTNQHLVPYLLTRFDLSALDVGDGLVTNLPYPFGPGHLNDIALVAPIFREGRLIAIAANQAHHVDVGGFAPGSMPFGVSEIYQEGLQIPPVRLFKRWRMDEELWAMIRMNVRAPDEVRGDFEAQMTANGLASRRLNELLDRDGEEAVLGGAAALFAYAERRARSVIAAIPDGTYSFADVLEGDGLTERPIRVAVTITVAGEEMTFDFRDSDDAVDGPLNCRYASVGACVYYVLKVLGGADLPANAGAYRPLRILVRDGSIFGPTYPRAVCNANILTTQRIVDVISGALAEAIPERIGAACSGTMNLVNIGTRTRDGADFTNLVETYGGGQGGLPGQDGMDGVQTHMTNTKNAPVEVLERAYPLYVLGYGLRARTGGAGRWRGGCGVWRRYRLEADSAMVTLSSDRAINAPWGLHGGGPGLPSRCLVFEDGRRRRIPSKASFRIRRGAELVIETPGGGGWGDPAGRDPAATERDRRSGLA